VNEDSSDSDPFVTVRHFGERTSDDGGDTGGEDVGLTREYAERSALAS